MGEEAYAFETKHFDGVIEGYREMVVRDGLWDSTDITLTAILERLYALVPTPDSTKPDKASPPSHLQLHLLHLSSRGQIYSHVDNLEASGDTIIGLSLGGSRLMKFAPNVGMEGEAFEMEVEKGSVYIQK